MANLVFDFSKRDIIQSTKSERDNSEHFLYKDINTSNIFYKSDRFTGKDTIKEGGSSHYDANAIKNALTNILNFKSGENILDPEFGIGDVYQMLYTPFDKHTTEKMLKTIRSIIGRYEPRIEIISIPTEYDPDKQEFCMTINYFIPSLSINDTMKYYLSK